MKVCKLYFKEQNQYNLKLITSIILYIYINFSF